MAYCLGVTNPERHIMLDLETFSLAPNASIVQIGACTLGGQRHFEVQVALQSCLLAGLKTDEETVEWWRRQPGANHDAITRDALPLELALLKFQRWVGGIETLGPLEGIWSNGAGFDLPILRNAYAALGMKEPWLFHRERCHRTVRALAYDLGWQDRTKVNPTAHTALRDAKSQAVSLVDALRFLEEKRRES